MDNEVSVTGVILAGGEGKRFGKPKAEQWFIDEPLIERVVRNLGVVADTIVVVAAPNQTMDSARLNGALLIRDEVPHIGPLAALHRALSTLERGLAVVVGCDMPFLDPAVIHHQIAMLGANDACIPTVDGRPQPLHGVFRLGCADVAANLLRKGERSLHALLSSLSVRYLDEGEWQQFSPTGSTFYNINTPDELAEALAIAKQYLL